MNSHRLNWRKYSIVAAMIVSVMFARAFWTTRDGGLFYYSPGHRQAWALRSDTAMNGSTFYTITGGNHVIGQHASVDGAIWQAILGYIPDA